MVPFGQSVLGGLAAATARYPTATAIVDDDGDLTYRQLWVASDAVARELRNRGLGPGSTVGVLGRNHRSFVVAMHAAAKIGADVVLLNTDLAAPRVREVCKAQGIAALLHDDTVTDLVAEAAVPTVLSGTAMAQLAEVSGPWRPAVPSRHIGRTIILTSGTTGRPKGVERASTPGFAGIASTLATIPIRLRDTVVLAAPLFHGWGLATLTIALSLSCTVLVRRRFEPEDVVAQVASSDADVLVTVPVVLRRIHSLGGDVLIRHDTSSLRAIASSGSALGPSLATETLRRFGPVLHNVYGSSEVSLATAARPHDLLDEPGTAGRPVPGVTVRVLDDDDQPVPVGTVGRVFVGSPTRFDGYTHGGGKATVHGLLSTGDIGHIDEAGRLSVDGREDDMIVSGGENVYPADVEELLVAHPAVAEAAVIGVADDEFGRRLKAFVVLHPGVTFEEAAVREHVRAHLSRFQVPREVAYRDVLPRTTTGKLKRRDLT